MLRSEAQRAEQSTRLGSSLAAALPDGLFEHPVAYSSTIVHVQLVGYDDVQNCFSTAC